MTILRLDPPEWLYTPLGEAEGCYLIDRGPEHHLQWVCWIIATGECWTFDNKFVRRAENATKGRPAPAPITNWPGPWPTS